MASSSLRRCPRRVIHCHLLSVAYRRRAASIAAHRSIHGPLRYGLACACRFCFPGLQARFCAPSRQSLCRDRGRFVPFKGRASLASPSPDIAGPVFRAKSAAVGPAGPHTRESRWSDPGALRAKRAPAVWRGPLMRQRQRRRRLCGSPPRHKRASGPARPPNALGAVRRLPDMRLGGPVQWNAKGS